MHGLAPCLLVQERLEKGGGDDEASAVELSGGAGPEMCTRMYIYI